MGEVVSTSLSDGIAVVRVDKPPVNAMDQSVRAGLKRAFSELRAKPDVKAIVLACAGRTFIAGADIKEFDTGIAEPGYHEVFRLIEDSPSAGGRCRFTAPRSAAARKSRSPAITALPPRARASACPSLRSASFPARAARSACRA